MKYNSLIEVTLEVLNKIKLVIWNLKNIILPPQKDLREI